MKTKQRRKSLPCPVCRQAVSAPVGDDGKVIIPPHGHKNACQGVGKSRQYSEPLTQHQARTMAQQILEVAIEQKRAAAPLALRVVAAQAMIAAQEGQ